MKLYVDDIRNAPDETWTVARSVDSAISFISQFGAEIDEISLDHDISHQVAVDGRQGLLILTNKGRIFFKMAYQGKWKEIPIPPSIPMR